jgi:hypothetical protein
MEHPLSTPRTAGPRHNGAVWTGRQRPKPRHRCHCGALAYWQCAGPGTVRNATCDRWLCRLHRHDHGGARAYCVWHKDHAA